MTAFMWHFRKGETLTTVDQRGWKAEEPKEASGMREFCALTVVGAALLHAMIKTQKGGGLTQVTFVQCE